MTSMMLAAEAAMNAIADCGIDKNEIDGLFSGSLGGISMVHLAHYLGITPNMLDGTCRH
jgi:3-oxoacyl-[acyl-carrier-protein] synthase III